MSYQDIVGWMNFEDVYDDAIARASDGDTLVEVGVANGRSLMYLAGRALDSVKSLRVYGIDQWLGAKEYADIIDGMIRHCPREAAFARILRGSSLDMVTYFDDASLSFAFIDADHSYGAVKADIAAWKPKIKPGGMLAGHDFSTADWPGVVRAVEEAFGPQIAIGSARYCWGVTL
jgi:predicted O-methyltransferase YrrM